MSSLCKNDSSKVASLFLQGYNSTLVLHYQLVVPIIHVWVSIPHVMFMSAPNAQNCRERLLWDMQEELFCFVLDGIIFCALCTIFIFGQFARKSCIQVAFSVVYVCNFLQTSIDFSLMEKKEGSAGSSCIEMICNLFCDPFLLFGRNRLHVTEQPSHVSLHCIVYIHRNPIKCLDLLLSFN